jgi:hypothetical protein
MPCLEMGELEAICSQYEERRSVAIPPSSERRNRAFWKVSGQASPHCLSHPVASAKLFRVWPSRAEAK